MSSGMFDGHSTISISIDLSVLDGVSMSGSSIFVFSLIVNLMHNYIPTIILK